MGNGGIPGARSRSAYSLELGVPPSVQPAAPVTPALFVSSKGNVRSSKTEACRFAGESHTAPSVRNNSTQRRSQAKRPPRQHSIRASSIESGRLRGSASTRSTTPSFHDRLIALGLQPGGSARAPRTLVTLHIKRSKPSRDNSLDPAARLRRPRHDRAHPLQLLPGTFTLDGSRLKHTTTLPLHGDWSSPTESG